VLTGDDTIVTDGDRIAVNALAAPALATAGTGDVLSGITAAMLARGLEPFAAACAAVFAHARAGRDAARRIGLVESVIATDVIDSIPAGMRAGAPVE
jgi:NAD(P)H-hydrate epimerase